MKNIFSKVMIKSIILIFLSIIFVFTSAYYFIVKTKNQICLKDEQYLSEIAMENSNVIEKIVNMNLDKIEAIANIIGNQDEFSEEYTLDILKLESQRSAFKRMGYAALDGNAITSDDEKLNIKTREYFIKAASGESNVSDIIEDKVGIIEDEGGDNLINVYAVPLYHQGKIQGVIFASSERDSFNKILSTPTFGGEGFSYIIAKEDTPVVYAENKNVLKELNNLYNDLKINNDEVLTMKKNMEQDKNGIFKYSVDGVKRVAAYCKINVNNWYVFSTVPKYVISKSADRFICINTLIVFIITVIFLFLVIFIIVQNHKSRIQLEQVAYFDELIGFPNYNAFKERAQKIIKKNHHNEFVFIKLDVDNFKLINDRLGFEMGDVVLKNIAMAIAEIVCEPEELFARIIVDEFIIMLNSKKHKDLIEIRHKIIHKFLELMGPDFKYFVKFPAGIYITNKYENSFIDIFEKVNYAHKQAKLLSEQGGIGEFYYDEAVKQKAVRETEIENKMEAALKNKEFKCYLQPKYDLKTETIVGAEALVRWQEEDGNLIAPREFISLFEHNGFIVKLDMYMFKEVCRIIRSSIENREPIVTISVNFSRLHLMNPNFIDELVKISDAFKVPRKYIEIEITETAIFENEDVLIEVIHKLHAFGFTLSMDDFGTGYSSLGLLKNLPVDVIKIDRSFFTNNMYMKRAKSVVESIMLMAKKLNIYTVAEGVESREHIDFLREVGCDTVQGYYYAKPMTVTQFKELMQSQVEKTK